LYDVSGREIFKKQIMNNLATERINLSTLANGSYLIKVTRLKGEHSKTFKIIKN